MGKLDSNGSLKRTIVFADGRTKAIVDGGLATIAEADRSNLSAAAEKLLLRALLTDYPEISEPMARVYSGESSVKRELVHAFRSNVIGDHSEAASPHLLPLVRCAACVLRGCGVDPAFYESCHAVEHWNMTVDRLAAAKGPVAGRALLDEAGSYSSLLALHLEAPIDGYLSLIIDNWEVLGDCACTYRALADIVDMAEGSPHSPDAIKAFRSALEDCYKMGWRLA